MQMCFWKAPRRWQAYISPKRSVSFLTPPAQIELSAFIPPDIPYFRTFTMPWTKYVSIIDVLFGFSDECLGHRTRQFPHAFLSPPVESPTFNAAS